MTQLLTRSPAIRYGDDTVDWHAHRPAQPADPAGLRPGDPGRRAAEPDPSGPTLADVVARAWEVLGAELPAACPVCGGELIPHPPAAGGRCESCGSTLS